MRQQKVLTAAALALMLVLATVIPGLAQSTTKKLSTNFTLVNLGSSTATGIASYYKPDGTAWGDGEESFTINDPLGQLIFRQYYPAGELGNPSLTDGNGSVVVLADQPLAAVVQIQARGQDPTTNGAYSGFDGGDTSFYVPLVARKLSTASGLGNSQIIVQNTGEIPAAIEIEMINADATSRYIKTSTVQPGASFYYDLDLESAANVPDNWYGSAVARTTTVDASIAVVSNFFTGHAMQTFNGFSSTSPGTEFFAPLFTARLANSLSTVIAVQNLSGGPIPAGGVEVSCTPDPGLTGYDPLTMYNTAEIGDTASYFFNPVTDLTIPAGFYGACRINSGSADIVSFVQMRFIAQGEAAAYEAIPAGGTAGQAIIPLMAKRLSNGFATVATIQNKTASTIYVDLTYMPSAEYTGSSTPVQINGVEIGPYGSLLQNLRTVDGVTDLPAGWYGSLTVTSQGGEAIDSFVQLTFARFINPSIPSGDNFMAHNGFTQ